MALVVTVTAVVLLGATTGVADGDGSSLLDADGAMDCSWLSDRSTTLRPAQERNAKIIAVVANSRGLDSDAAAVGVAAALAESTLFNFANDGTSTLIGSLEGRQLNDTERAVARRSLNYPHDDIGNNLDSIGLFQQRPMTGWGPPEVLINPAKAAGLFFDTLVRIPDWQSLPPWEAAQAVQGSPSTDGSIYRRSFDQAVGIVDAVTGDPFGSVVPPDQVTAIVDGLCRPSGLRGRSRALVAPLIGDAASDHLGG